MVITGAVAAIVFMGLAYWLGAHRGHFWLSALCFIIVGVLIGGTSIGSRLDHGALALLNGVYNAAVSVVHL